MQAEGKCGYCTGMARLAGMKWSLFPASRWEIAGLGKSGQAKWNQVGNRKMEEREPLLPWAPEVVADNEQNET